MNKCLLLTEAGEGIGFGHLMRCTGILDAINKGKSQHQMLLAVKGNLTIHHPSIHENDWLNNPSKLIFLKEDFDLVLIDSYLATAEFYLFLKKTFQKVLVIDDYNRIEYPIASLLNPNIYGNDLDYTLRSDQTLFAGKDYVILREEFRKNTIDYIVREEVKNILITVGGSDVRALIPKILDILPTHYNLKVIAGSPVYQQELAKKYTANNIQFDGFVDALRMKELMLWSDICVAANGQTLHELAFLGVPTIGICIDIDQVPNTKHYAASGILQGELLWDAADFETQLLDAIQHYKNKTVREKKASLGKQFIDGQGVHNIAELLLAL